jgi:hypothetical protein
VPQPTTLPRAPESYRRQEGRKEGRKEGREIEEYGSNKETIQNNESGIKNVTIKKRCRRNQGGNK